MGRKLIVILTVALFIMGCKLNAIYTRYIIKNDTDYTMKIVAYYKSRKFDEITINSKDALVKEVIWSGDNAESSIFDKSLGSGIGTMRDSVVIIFDDRKAIVQFCQKGVDLIGCYELTADNPIIKNVANIISIGEMPNVEVKRKGLKKRTGPLTITFDNSDYERAVEL